MTISHKPRGGEPIVTRSLIKWLKEQYPPHCYAGRGETLEHHLVYAGRVELIADLEEIAERQAEDEDALAALAREEMEAIDAEEHEHLAVHVASLGGGL